MNLTDFINSARKNRKSPEVDLEKELATSLEEIDKDEFIDDKEQAKQEADLKYKTALAARNKLKREKQAAQKKLEKEKQSASEQKEQANLAKLATNLASRFKPVDEDEEEDREIQDIEDNDDLTEQQKKLKKLELSAERKRTFKNKLKQAEEAAEVEQKNLETQRANAQAARELLTRKHQTGLSTVFVKPPPPVEIADSKRIEANKIMAERRKLIEKNLLLGKKPQEGNTEETVVPKEPKPQGEKPGRIKMENFGQLGNLFEGKGTTQPAQPKGDPKVKAKKWSTVVADAEPEERGRKHVERTRPEHSRPEPIAFKKEPERVRSTSSAKKRKKDAEYAAQLEAEEKEVENRTKIIQEELEKWQQSKKREREMREQKIPPDSELFRDSNYELYDTKTCTIVKKDVKRLRNEIGHVLAIRKDSERNTDRLNSEFLKLEDERIRLERAQSNIERYGNNVIGKIRKYFSAAELKQFTKEAETYTSRKRQYEQLKTDLNTCRVILDSTGTITQVDNFTEYYENGVIDVWILTHAQLLQFYNNVSLKEFRDNKLISVRKDMVLYDLHRHMFDFLYLINKNQSNKCIFIAYANNPETRIKSRSVSLPNHEYKWMTNTNAVMNKDNVLVQVDSQEVVITLKNISMEYIQSHPSINKLYTKYLNDDYNEQPAPTEHKIEKKVKPKPHFRRRLNSAPRIRTPLVPNIEEKAPTLHRTKIPTSAPLLKPTAVNTNTARFTKTIADGNKGFKKDIIQTSLPLKTRPHILQAAKPKSVPLKTPIERVRIRPMSLPLKSKDVNAAKPRNTSAPSLTLKPTVPPTMNVLAKKVRLSAPRTLERYRIKLGRKPINKLVKPLVEPLVKLKRVRKRNRQTKKQKLKKKVRARQLMNFKIKEHDLKFVPNLERHRKKRYKSEQDFSKVKPWDVNQWLEIRKPTQQLARRRQQILLRASALERKLKYMDDYNVQNHIKQNLRVRNLLQDKNELLANGPLTP